MSKPIFFLVDALKAWLHFFWIALKEHIYIFLLINLEKEISYFSCDKLIYNSYHKDYKVRSGNNYLKKDQLVK